MTSESDESLLWNDGSYIPTRDLDDAMSAHKTKLQISTKEIVPVLDEIHLPQESSAREVRPNRRGKSGSNSIETNDTNIDAFDYAKTWFANTHQNFDKPLSASTKPSGGLQILDFIRNRLKKPKT